MLLLLLSRGRGRTGWRGGCHAPSTKSPATARAAAAAAVAARDWASKGSHARPPRCNHSARRRARAAAAACSAPAREGSAPDPLHTIVGIFHSDPAVLQAPARSKSRGALEGGVTGSRATAGRQQPRLAFGEAPGSGFKASVGEPKTGAIVCCARTSEFLRQRTRSDFRGGLGFAQGRCGR